MKRKRNLIVAALLAVVAFVATACDVSDKGTTSWQTDGLSTTNVYTTAKVGSVVVLGGNFSRVYAPDNRTWVAAGGLAAFDANTGAKVWTANPGGTVYRVVADGSTVWVLGTFGLKKYNSNGVLNAAWKPALTVGQIRSGLAVGPDAVYVGGTSGVQAINKANAHTIWRTPLAGGDVYTLSYARNNAGPRIIVGGYFCTVKGISRPGLASLGTNGAVDTRFNAPAFNCGVGTPSQRFDTARAVLDTTPYGTSVFIAGGGSLNRAARVDVNTGTVTWAAPTGDGDVQAVAVQGSYLYIGGHFACVQSSSRGCLQPAQKAARYTLAAMTSTSAGTALSTNWKPNFREGFDGVWTITPDVSALYVGGNFNSLNGAVHHKFAIFRP